MLQARSHLRPGWESRDAVSMTGTEQSILAALLELERTVEAMPHTTPKPESAAAIFAARRTYSLIATVSTDPTLLHYLHKKSYQKARLFLQGRDAENHAGNCRHVDHEGRAWTPERAAEDGARRPGTLMLDDTIAAIATPLGEGALAVIRLSGEDAFSVADKVFVPHGKSSSKIAEAPTHTLQYGHIVRMAATWMKCSWR